MQKTLAVNDSHESGLDPVPEPVAQLFYAGGSLENPDLSKVLRRLRTATKGRKDSLTLSFTIR
ncbi:hypothetical protein J2X90_005590 [Variovorax paradoxus]|nr:hypothetical protein [Variovorax paradoxus]